MILAVPLDIPVDPDAPEARRLLIDELAKPVYQASRPTWFDQLSQGFWQWVQSLFTGPSGNAGGIIPLAIVIALVVVLVVAALVFGLPRLNRRSSAREELFGDEASLTAGQLRDAAARAAASEDWSTAIIERFRALAKSLADRTIVTVLPGTTADDVARQATSAFPDQQARLAGAARVFDEVRYLDRVGSPRSYRDLVALDDDLERRSPVLADAVLGGAE